MKKTMMCAFVALVSFGCVENNEMDATLDASTSITSSDDDNFGTVVSPLSTPCAQETWKTDCAKELVLAAGDDCVKWPGGVWCHPVNQICVLTVDAECYFKKGANECAVDADCDDGNSCTFETCLTDDDVSSCYAVDFPDGSPCGYSKALDALMVCESHPQLAAPACVPDLDDDPECANDADCNDDIACTYDLCDALSETCSHASIPECCATNADCAADKPYCVETLFPPAVGVKWCQPCLQDADDTGCPAQQQCMWGIGSTQSPLPIGGKSVYWCAECVVDSQCADNDPCTIDICSDNETCSHTLDSACGAIACETSQDCAYLAQPTCENGVLHTPSYACNNAKKCVGVGGGVGVCVKGCANAQACNPECTTNSDCAHLNDLFCAQGNLLVTVTGTCAQGECYDLTSNSACEFGCAQDACLPKPECMAASGCSDAPQFSSVACTGGNCIYGEELPVVKVVWDMTAGWWIDYAHLEGTFCEQGTQPGNSFGSGAIKSGTCKMSAGWGPFLTTGMVQNASVWNTQTNTIESANGDPKVTGYIPVPAGAHFMIVNWVFSHNNKPKNWLCDDTEGPKGLGDAWDGKGGWGQHHFYAPDGTILPVEIHPGNNLEGCLFWVNVSSIAAKN